MRTYKNNRYSGRIGWLMTGWPKIAWEART
jgi:hypothetical protein